MLFRDIIGQSSVKGRLRLSVQERRIPHAQLFTGPEGIGKLQLAIAYAQYIACDHVRAALAHGDEIPEDSCGKCPSCLQHQNLQHPDLHFVFPIVKTDMGDTCDDFADSFRQVVLEKHYFNLDDWYVALGVETKQGLIYEKESIEILRKLSLKSFSGGYKVMIIWQPEKMNITCANKLLKLLEEPPEETLFILVSEQPDQLLSTILSRTQQISIPKLSDEEITEALIARQLANEVNARGIAHIANGSFLHAQRLAEENTTNTQFFNDFTELMRNAWLVGQRKNYGALLKLRKWSLDMADSKVGREKQKAFLQYLQRQIRENYIYNLKHPEMNYQTEEEANFSTKFAPFIHNGNVEKIMNDISKAEQQIAQNGNAKIIFFDLCLQMIVNIK